MNVVPDNLYQARIYRSEQAERQESLRTVLDVARRRWRIVLLSMIACLSLAILYVATSPSSFTATTVLLLDTKQTPPSPTQLSQEPLIDPAVVESQIEIVKSQRIARQVVAKLGLETVPEFAGTPGLLSRLADGIFGSPKTTPDLEARRSGAADALTHKIKVTRTGHSYLAEIAATTLDPARSAAVANAIAEAYIQDQLESRLHANERTVAWMAQRVSDVKGQADAAAAALAQFRQAKAAEIAAGDSGVAAKLRGLQEAADNARADYDALQNRSLRLTQFIQQQSLPTTEARVLTEADPPTSKSAPKTTIIVLLAFVAGGVLGAGLAALRETLDHKLRRPRQVAAELGLPFAGAVPPVRRARGELLARLFDSQRPWCAATETLRAVKLAVDQTIRRDAGVVIGIVSAWPAEGKSTLTLNLATILAEIGARVLVVDADLKKPDLSEAIGREAPCGLVELIDGKASADQCVVGTEDGFDLLGNGQGMAPLHPFEKLGSQRMQGTLAGARAGYDYVLLDLPALLTTIDAQAAAPFVDAFVMVAEAGRTTVDDVARALSTSETVASRLVSLVLNKSRTARASARTLEQARAALVSA